MSTYSGGEWEKAYTHFTHWLAERNLRASSHDMLEYMLCSTGPGSSAYGMPDLWEAVSSMLEYHGFEAAAAV